jgi:hypothetical protein
MQRTAALRTPDIRLPSPDCHVTFVTRHVVGTAKLYKYRYGVRLRAAKCDTGQRNVWL